MELIRDITLYVFAAAFLSGLLITAFTGSARAVKAYLAVLAAITLLAMVAGFWFSGGWLVFVFTQLIVLVLLLFFAIIAGAAAGGGIYLLNHRKPPGKQLRETDLSDYLPGAEFAAREGITEERALARIRSGYYRGGLHAGNWYIHKDELTLPSPNNP